jgi:hypothetical protein
VTSTANPTPAFTSALDPRIPNLNRTAYTYNAGAGYSYVTNNNLYVSDKETVHEVDAGGGVRVVPCQGDELNRY